MPKTFFLFFSFLIFFYPIFANGAESEANQRKKIISVFQTPQQISQLDWIFLQWKVYLLNSAIKKVLIDEFEEKENCGFGEIRLDEDKSAISVPILCMDDILKNSKQKRLDIIEEWALRYLRLFDSRVWSGWKSSKETFEQLKNLFMFRTMVIITDKKGNAVENIEIGSYEFGKKKLPEKGK